MPSEEWTVRQSSESEHGCVRSSVALISIRTPYPQRDGGTCPNLNGLKVKKTFPDFLWVLLFLYACPFLPLLFSWFSSWVRVHEKILNKPSLVVQWLEPWTADWRRVMGLIFHSRAHTLVVDSIPGHQLMCLFHWMFLSLCLSPLFSLSKINGKKYPWERINNHNNERSWIKHLMSAVTLMKIWDVTEGGSHCAPHIFWHAALLPLLPEPVHHWPQELQASGLIDLIDLEI